MGYRTELVLGCLGVNLATDIILFVYDQYSPRHVWARIACYGVMFLFTWLMETREPFNFFRQVIKDLFNRSKDRRRKYIGRMINRGEVRGKAKVIRIHSDRGM